MLELSPPGLIRNYPVFLKGENMPALLDGVCKRLAHVPHIDSLCSKPVGHAIGICTGKACLRLDPVVYHGLDLGLHNLPKS